MDIEHHLSTLKPANQAELARRILAIPAQRRQRRRDCVFGFGGLLTGIVATLMVVMWLPSATVEVAVVQYVEDAQERAIVSPQLDIDESAWEESLAEHQGANSPPLLRDTAPIDLDEWIVRYEGLFRHRYETASRTTFVRPRTISVSFNGDSPLEYRNRLMQEI